MNNNFTSHEKLKIKSLFKNIFFYLKKNKKIFLIIFLSITVFFYSFLWIKKTNYVVLYKNLSSNDSSQEILKKLMSLKIPYKYYFQSDSLLIPRDKIEIFRSHFHDYKSDDKNLLGFELLDQEKFGISTFHEQVNYQRALEGELSRTIGKLNFVRSVRVHIVFPRMTSFFNEENHASASVFLNVNKKIKLNLNFYNSIIHLLSKSVLNLKKKDIIIVNQYGDFFTGNGEFSKNFLYRRYIKNISLIEKKYKDKIEKILTPILGSKNFVVQVSLDNNFNIKDQLNNFCDKIIKKKCFLNLKKEDIIYFKKNNFFTIQLKGLNKKNVIYANRSCCQTYDNYLKNIFFKNIQGCKNFYIKNNFYYSKKKQNKISFLMNLKDNFLYKKRKTGSLGKIHITVLVNYKRNSKGTYVPLSIKDIFNIKRLIELTMHTFKDFENSIDVINYKFFDTEPLIEKYVPIKKNEFFDKTVILAPWFLVFFFLVLFLTSFFSFKKLTKKIQGNSFGISDSLQKYFENSDGNIKKNVQNVNFEFKKKNIKNSSIFLKENSKISSLIIQKWIKNK